MFIHNRSAHTCMSIYVYIVFLKKVKFVYETLFVRGLVSQTLLRIFLSTL
jgi:hypothetical protein